MPEEIRRSAIRREERGVEPVEVCGVRVERGRHRPVRPDQAVGRHVGDLPRVHVDRRAPDPGADRRGQEICAQLGSRLGLESASHRDGVRPLRDAAKAAQSERLQEAVRERVDRTGSSRGFPDPLQRSGRQRIPGRGQQSREQSHDGHGAAPALQDRRVQKQDRHREEAEQHQDLHVDVLPDDGVLPRDEQGHRQDREGHQRAPGPPGRDPGDEQDGPDQEGAHAELPFFRSDAHRRGIAPGHVPPAREERGEPTRAALVELPAAQQAGRGADEGHPRTREGEPETTGCQAADRHREEGAESERELDEHAESGQEPGRSERDEPLGGLFSHREQEQEHEKADHLILEGLDGEGVEQQSQ